MPGTLAHWLVAREMALRIIADDDAAAELLRASPLVALENRVPRKYRNGRGEEEENWAREEARPLMDLPAFFGFDGGLSEYLYLGAILPDLGDFASQVSRAARLASLLAHRRRPGRLTAEMILIARDLLEKGRSYERRGKTFPHLRRYAHRYLCVALGQISHCCADALIHPEIQSICGTRENPSIPADDPQLRELSRFLFQLSGRGRQARRSASGPLLRLAIRSPFVRSLATGRFGDLHRIIEAHQDSWVAKHYFRRFQVDDSAETWTDFLDRITSAVSLEEAIEFGARRVAQGVRKVVGAGGGAPVSVSTRLLPPQARLLVGAIRAAAVVARYPLEKREGKLDFREWFHEHREGEGSDEVFRVLRKLVHRAYLRAYGAGFAHPPGSGRRLPFGSADLEDGIPVYYSVLLANAYDGGWIVPDNPYMPFVAFPAYRSGRERERIVAREGLSSRKIREREAEIGVGYLRRLLEAADLSAQVGLEAIRLFRGEIEVADFRRSLPDWNLETGRRICVVPGEGEGEVRIRLTSAEEDRRAMGAGTSSPPGPHWAGTEAWRNLGRMLARRGAPILYQTLDDPFRPVSIRKVVGHPRIRLLDPDGEVIPRDPSDSAYKLNRDLHPYFHTDRHVLDLTDLLQDPREVRRLQEEATVHFRQKRLLTQGRNGVFRGERIVIQYWLFYLKSRASLPDGSLREEVMEEVTEHQGDWEFLQVIWEREGGSLEERDRWGWEEADADGWRPAWVGASIHYYGEGRRFLDLREEGRCEEGRPVIYVAEGGHGCHFEEGVIPSFSGMESKGTTPPGALGKVPACDYTSADCRLRPEGARPRDGVLDETYSLVEIEDQEPWLDWPGHFGRPGAVTCTASGWLRLLERAGSAGAWAARRLLGYLLPRGPRGPKYRHPMRESVGLKRDAHDLNMWSRPMEWQAEFSRPEYRNAPLREPVLFDARWVDPQTLRPVGPRTAADQAVALRLRGVNLPEDASIWLVPYRGPPGACRQVANPLRARRWKGRPGIYVASLGTPLAGLAGDSIHFTITVRALPTLRCESDHLAVD